jgi:hypothetical protein
VARTTRWNQTIAGVARLIKAASGRLQDIEIVYSFFSPLLYAKQ